MLLISSGTLLHDIHMEVPSPSSLGLQTVLSNRICFFKLNKTIATGLANIVIQILSYLCLRSIIFSSNYNFLWLKFLCVGRKIKRTKWKLFLTELNTKGAEHFDQSICKADVQWETAWDFIIELKKRNAMNKIKATAFFISANLYSEGGLES